MDNQSPSIITKNVSAEAIQLFETFWKRELAAVESTTSDDFRNQELPLARIKKIMKLDEDVKMISGEAPILFAKAVEIFIAELSLRAWINTEESKRRTLQRTDISAAIAKYDQFDFLIDIVPRETHKQHQQNNHHHQSSNKNKHLYNNFSNLSSIIHGQQAPPQQLITANADQLNYLLQIASPTSTAAAAGAQPIQILQSNPAQFSLATASAAPQIIPIPPPLPPSSTTNDNLPITLSSQQYQQLLQNQQHQNSQTNQIILPTQFITAAAAATGGQPMALISAAAASAVPQPSASSSNDDTNSSATKLIQSMDQNSTNDSSNHVETSE